MKINTPKKTEKTHVLSDNKKAFHDYNVMDTLDAGIVLNGDEVKSIKTGHINLKGSFVDVFSGECYLNNAHVSKYKNSSKKEFEETRRRKLLLRKKEIEKLFMEISQKGTTAIPLKVFTHNNLIKIQIGICRGKKLYDKREDLKKKAHDLEINRELKKYKYR
ncbi:MAG: SsrA-binding protein SmpB [Candidatus Gracilibacteria bacterium]|jgi:SsrA-binding protein